MRVSRRRFIRNVVTGTAVSAFRGEPWVGTVLADLQAQPSDGILRVRIGDFPALQNQDGSVRLAFNPFSSTGPTGAFYPVLINRGANEQFFSLSTECQHASCVVPVYSAASGASTCPCHGSQYGLDGRVLRGPTVRPLIAYPNSFDGSILSVAIPNLGFSLTVTALQSGTGPRLQLGFPTKSNVKYQVLLRQSLIDEGTVVPFATTSEGSATTMLLSGTGATASVFVDRTAAAGFYSVAVQVTQG